MNSHYFSNNMMEARSRALSRRVHIHKLRHVRPRIDTRSPARFRHIQTQLKKERLLEDRFTEIERENRILLEKMNKIFNRKNSYSVQRPLLRQPSRARGIDLVPRAVSRVVFT